jgi:hypothetical protein
LRAWLRISHLRSLSCPLGVFLPVFAYAGFRRVVRSGRQRLEKLGPPTSCIICGEPFAKASLWQVRGVQNSHYETVHPDFWRWVKKPRRRMLLAVLSTSLIIWATQVYELAIGNYLPFIAGTVVQLVLVLAWSWFQKRKLKSFRSRWQMSR